MIPHTNKEWEVFIDRTRSKYYAIIISIVKNPEEAEDILQDTYMKLFLNKETYQSLEKLGGYIAFRGAINHFRTMRTRKKHMYERGLGERLLADIIDPGDNYEWRQQLDLVMELLSEGKQAEYLKLHAEGYSYKEISEKYGVAMGTVKASIHNMRKMLIEKLKDQ